MSLRRRSICAKQYHYISEKNVFAHVRYLGHATSSIIIYVQSGDTDLERFLVYLCIGVKLLILDTLSTYTYEIDLKNLHLNTPFLLVLNNSMRGGVNNFMPFRKQRLSKCCIFGDIFSKYMNLSIFVLRLI